VISFKQFSISLVVYCLWLINIGFSENLLHKTSANAPAISYELATPPVLLDPEGARLINTSRDILWSQLNPGTGLVASQDFESNLDGYDCYAADDFVVGDEFWTIQQINISGMIFSADQGPVNAFTVRLMEDSAGQPGVLQQMWSGLEFNQHADIYQINLPFSGITLDSGTFWISIQAQMNSADGQFGWLSSVDVANSGFYWINPGGLFEHGVDWNSSAALFPAYANLSFSLDGYIGLPPAIDLTIAEVVSPQSDFELTASESLSVVIQNNGSDSQQFFDCAYRLNAGEWNTELIVSTLAAGDTIHHTFISEMDMSEIGGYDLEICVTQPEDENPANDCLAVSLEHYPGLTDPVDAVYELENCGNHLNDTCDTAEIIGVLELMQQLNVVASLDSNDQDWFRFDVHDDSAIEINLMSETAVTLVLYENCDTDCNLMPELQRQTVVFPDSSRQSSACLSAGSYLLKLETQPDLPSACPRKTLISLTGESCIDEQLVDDCHPLSLPDESWSFLLTENSQDYLRYEHFSASEEYLIEVAFQGLQLQSVENFWLPCSEDSVMFGVSFYADGCVPGAELYSEQVYLSAMPTSIIYADAFEAFDFRMTLAEELQLQNGWLSIESLGNDDCWFLLGTSQNGLDGYSLLERESGLELVDNDLAICIGSVNCEPPQDVNVEIFGGTALVSWSAVSGAIDYRIFHSQTGSYNWRDMGLSDGRLYFRDFLVGNYNKFYRISSVCEPQ
jgi:hypothetical protein